jgi:hypothetical protein
MESGMKIDIKNMLSTLYEITSDTEEFISSMQTAFIYNISNPLQGCKEKAEEHGREADHLSAIIKEAAPGNQSLEAYVPIPDHLLKIWKGLDRLSDHIGKKITEQVLFSDKAVNETIYLLQRLVEILGPTSDMILARNTFLNKYIQEAQASIEKMADEYATLHENRLIRGECLNAASSIYVGMLEAIKSIAWHTREIASTLST